MDCKFLSALQLQFPRQLAGLNFGIQITESCCLNAYHNVPPFCIAQTLMCCSLAPRVVEKFKSSSKATSRTNCGVQKNHLQKDQCPFATQQYLHGPQAERRKKHAHRTTQWDVGQGVLWSCRMSQSWSQTGTSCHAPWGGGGGVSGWGLGGGGAHRYLVKPSTRRALVKPSKSSKNNENFFCKKN